MRLIQKKCNIFSFFCWIGFCNQPSPWTEASLYIGIKPNMYKYLKVLSTNLVRIFSTHPIVDMRY